MSTLSSPLPVRPTHPYHFTVPLHEPYDKFSEKIKWGECIYGSNKNQMKLWMENIINNPNSFQSLQFILFNGIDAIQKTELNPSKIIMDLHQLHPNHQIKSIKSIKNPSIVNPINPINPIIPSNSSIIHPINPSNPSMNSSIIHSNFYDSSDVSSDELSDDSDDSDNNSTNDSTNNSSEKSLYTIGKDLTVYICQFLDLIDLIVFERLSHHCFYMARDPSALYSLTIVHKRIDKIHKLVLEIKNKFININDLGILAKFRFANLRKLELGASLYNMRWTQLFHLKIYNKFDLIPKQNKLEYLQCDYDVFHKMVNNEIIPISLLKSLSVMSHKRNKLQNFECYLPELKTLYIDTRDWTDSMKIIQLMKFRPDCPLQSLDFYNEQWVHCDLETVKQDLMYLLQLSNKIIMFTNSNQAKLFPVFLSVICKPTNQFICNDLDLFVNVDFFISLSDKDLLDIKQCSVWNDEIWSNFTSLSSNIQKIHCTVALTVGFKYSSHAGYVYVVDVILYEIEEYILDQLKKLGGTQCKITWDPIETANNPEELYEFDLSCEFNLNH